MGVGCEEERECLFVGFVGEGKGREDQDMRMHQIRCVDLLTSRWATSTFQLLIMKYLVSNELQRLMSERSLFKKRSLWR